MIDNTTLTMNQTREAKLEDLFPKLVDLKREDYASPAYCLALDYDATVPNGRFSLGALHNGEKLSWEPTPFAIEQMCGRMSPGLAPLSRKLIGEGWQDILCNTANQMLARMEMQWQIRTIQPNGHRLARAVLSDAYRPMDDSDTLPTMLQILGDASNKWKYLGGGFSDTRSALKFICREPFMRIGQREIFVGFMYTNSEVGSGKTQFVLFFYDSFCENGCIFGKIVIADVNYVHRGARISTQFGQILNERVHEVERASIASLIHDATIKAVNGDFTEQVRQRIEGGLDRKLEGDRPAMIQNITKSLKLTDKESEGVLAHWDSREDNLFGVSNAITRLAQDAPSYDARTRLEQAGGEALSIGARQWNSILSLSR